LANPKRLDDLFFGRVAAEIAHNAEVDSMIHNARRSNADFWDFAVAAEVFWRTRRSG